MNEFLAAARFFSSAPQLLMSFISCLIPCNNAFVPSIHNSSELLNPCFMLVNRMAWHAVCMRRKHTWFMLETILMTDFQ